MADDTPRQTIGTIGGFVSAGLFWIGAYQANDRLLSHFERRFNQKGVEPIPWHKDHRLLFYILALICSVAYKATVWTQMMVYMTPNSVAGDSANVFMVATYLAMITMVFWTVLEGVETVKRLGQGMVTSAVARAKRKKRESELDNDGNNIGGGVAGSGGVSGSELGTNNSGGGMIMDDDEDDSHHHQQHFRESVGPDSSYGGTDFDDQDSRFGATNASSVALANRSTNNNNNQSANGRIGGGLHDNLSSDDSGFSFFEHRAMLSLVGVYGLYVVFYLITYIRYQVSGSYSGISQWSSAIISLVFGLMCCAQCIHTYINFKVASRELAFRFLSLFAILGFFLVTRAILVCPPVQHEIGEALLPATLFLCDSLSVVVLLYRVPKSKH